MKVMNLTTLVILVCCLSFLDAGNKESPCDKDSCMNGGTCGSNGICDCHTGFGGKLCEIECEHPKALGMESRKIADSQITASSEYNNLSTASNARLNFNKYAGSWQPKYKTNQWLQVDFKKKAMITDILTQGRGRLDQWVKKYTVSYSNDGKNFEAYNKRNGEEQEFKANVNMNSIVTKTLQPAIVARYVRIHPTDCQNHPSMRVEFKGCLEDQAICTIAGNPHYITFDGKTYNFMGHCEYILAKDTGDNFEVLGKNKRCGRGAVHTCLYSVTVKLLTFKLKIDLLRGDVVKVRGTNVSLPYNEEGVSIRKQCDGKVGITTTIGLDVEYDGIYNVFITVYGRYIGKTLGLCGNYNGNKRDDFMKPNGIATTNAQEFATSLKVDRDCHDTRSPPSNPCNKDSAKAKKAEMSCGRALRREPFKKCNHLVKVESFIKDCEYDYCSCKNDDITCLCEAFDAYATECSARGSPIIWKNRFQFQRCDQAICTIAGDPHYKTFDGKTYNFMGHCEYRLAKDTDDNFEVFGKNKRCGGGGVTCIYSVIVNLFKLKLKIELLRGDVVKVNGENVNLPYNEKGVSIRKQCDGKVGITTTIGLDVVYDGIYNVFITVYGRYIGKTLGLCGNYNGNKTDDFMKPNGITATNAQDFATSWKVDQDCHDTRPPPINPCNKDSAKAKGAEKDCRGLQRQPFKKCNDLVKVEGFIKDCEYDYCGCKNHERTCLCEALDVYATECSARGLPIIWKNLIQFKYCENLMKNFPNTVDV